MPTSTKLATATIVGLAGIFGVFSLHHTAIQAKLNRELFDAYDQGDLSKIAPLLSAGADPHARMAEVEYYENPFDEFIQNILHRHRQKLRQFSLDEVLISAVNARDVKLVSALLNVGA